MRNIKFAFGEFYHIYNRGVDKRLIFIDEKDFDRFFQGIEQFNTKKRIGNLSHGHRVSTGSGEGELENLVNIVAYAVNQNHFHFILTPVCEKGIEKFMHKLSMGYAKYFNTKYKRSGALWQGKFRAKHIDSNEYLLHLSAYINLNDKIHARGHRVSTGVTSWKEYLGNEYLGEAVDSICKKDIVLEQFNSIEEYKDFAENTLGDIVQNKIMIEDLENDGIELVNTI